MRKIKFRAWNKALNNGGGKPKMCSVWAICFADDYKSIRSIAVQEGKGIGSIRYRDFYNELMKEDNFTLMQFTGLKDKNGKPIFEGDIVVTKGDDTPMVIGWKEYHASFCIDKKGWLSSHYFGEAFDGDQCEIIGNIYENSHLLKEDNEQ